MSRGEGPDFWTRRKAAVAAEEAASRAAERKAEEDTLRAEVEAGHRDRNDDELLAEAGMPDPSELESPEAIRAFLDSELPDRLKTRALRRLWRLNPALANLDGLVDYGEDYTDAATVVEDLRTAYRVGRGIVRDLVETDGDNGEPGAPDLASAPANAEPKADLALDEAGASEDSKDTEESGESGDGPATANGTGDGEREDGGLGAASAGRDRTMGASAHPKADAARIDSSSGAASLGPTASSSNSAERSAMHPDRRLAERNLDPIPATERRMRFVFDD